MNWDIIQALGMHKDGYSMSKMQADKYCMECARGRKPSWLTDVVGMRKDERRYQANGRVG